MSKFLGTIVNGRVLWLAANGMKERLKDLEGQRVIVSIEPLRHTDANKFYWGFVVAPTVKHTGHSRNEVHETFKERFLAPGPDGIYSTRNLSVDQFADYTEQCLALAVEMGVPLENQWNPNELPAGADSEEAPSSVQ